MNEYGLCDQAGTNRDVATVDATTNRINKLLFKVAFFFIYIILPNSYCLMTACYSS
jgi:hypothetical protein